MAFRGSKGRGRASQGSTARLVIYVAVFVTIAYVSVKLWGANEDQRTALPIGDTKDDVGKVKDILPSAESTLKSVSQKVPEPSDEEKEDDAGGQEEAGHIKTSDSQAEVDQDDVSEDPGSRAGEKGPEQNKDAAATTGVGAGGKQEEGEDKESAEPAAGARQADGKTEAGDSAKVEQVEEDTQNASAGGLGTKIGEASTGGGLAGKDEEEKEGEAEEGGQKGTLVGDTSEQDAKESEADKAEAAEEESKQNAREQSTSATENSTDKEEPKAQRGESDDVSKLGKENWGGFEQLESFKCQLSGGVCVNAPWNYRSKSSKKARLPKIHSSASIETLSEDEKWVVMTVKTQNIRINMEGWDGWQKVIVAETSARKGRVQCGVNCTVLHKDHPAIQGYKLTSMVNWTTYARKMVGFLYAIEQGAKLILQSDAVALRGAPMRKVIPRMPTTWIEPLHTQGTSFPEESRSTRVVNPLEYLGWPTLWPRGYPASEAQAIVGGRAPNASFWEHSRETTFLPIQQGIPDWGPDLEPSCAPKKLAKEKVLFRRCHLPLALPEWVMSPINHKSTAFYQPAFHLMFLAGELAPSISDVFSGYWAQRLLWNLGGLVAHIHTESYVPPSWAADDDGESSLRSEEAREAGRLVKHLLGSWTCASSNALDCALSLGFELAQERFWAPSEVKLMSAWLEDLHAVGYRPLKAVGWGSKGREYQEGQIAQPKAIKGVGLPCGTYSRHWAVLRERLNKRARFGLKLCYPGNEVGPDRTVLESADLGLLPDRGRPLWPAIPVESPPRIVYLAVGPRFISEDLTDFICSQSAEVLQLTTEEDIWEALHAPNATWARARNLMFSAALQLERMRGWRNTFYIFLDDDVRADGSWRGFERFLVSHQPVLAQPDHTRWCRNLRPAGIHDFSPIYDVDPAMTAVHYEAAKQLLPYTTVYDDLEWWLAQTLVNHKAAVLYEGHMAKYKGLTTCSRDIPIPEYKHDGELKSLEAAFKAAVRALDEDAASCFRPLRRVVAMGGHSTYSKAVVQRTRPYDSIDYLNAPRCRQGRVVRG